jgi:predicted transcriptional regulator
MPPVEVIVPMRDAGMTSRQIAGRLGISPSSVSNILARAGMSMGGPSPAELPSNEVLAVEVASSSLASVARKYGASRDTIRKRVAEAERTPVMPMLDVDSKTPAWPEAECWRGTRSCSSLTTTGSRGRRGRRWPRPASRAGSA